MRRNGFVETCRKTHSLENYGARFLYPVPHVYKCCGRKAYSKMHNATCIEIDAGLDVEEESTTSFVD